MDQPESSVPTDATSETINEAASERDVLVSLTVRIPTEAMQFLYERARREQRSISQIVRFALKYYAEMLEES